MVYLVIPFPYWQISTSYVVRNNTEKISNEVAGATNLLADFSSMSAHKHGRDHPMICMGNTGLILLHIRKESVASEHFGFLSALTEIPDFATRLWNSTLSLP